MENERMCGKRMDAKHRSRNTARVPSAGHEFWQSSATFFTTCRAARERAVATHRGADDQSRSAPNRKRSARCRWWRAPADGGFSGHNDQAPALAVLRKRFLQS